MRLFSLPIVFLLGSLVTGPAHADETIYILFRHAEKTTERPDPGLSEAGKKRAASIGAYLQRMGVTRIFSSDYKRTRATVEPFSEATGISIEIYDPGDLDGFAETLSGMSGTIAISGHSDTTPELAALISGKATKPMPETDYDRLYTIIRTQDGETALNVSRLTP
ncbi:SixA phosphatase family protein [Elongatibacter sediminis]|uniref:Histidine phosphatase family protein n=1 Tax=Elongatibacter sediminis TaxID=3119006 RepID=A0AAW9RLE8_9GAMM